MWLSEDKLKGKISHFRKRRQLGWIASYLNGRMQYTAVNGYNSDTMPVSVGIPLGSVLGPTLFSLFVNDLPSSVNQAPFT